MVTSIYLVINCAQGEMQIVLGSREGVMYAQSMYVPGRAMKYMAPGIEHGLKLLDLCPEELAGIACVTGPGSFTGIRMSLAHSFGLSCTHNIPMAGISYLQALALGPASVLHGRLWVLVHSRQNQVYAQSFLVPELICATPARNISLDLLKDMLSAEKGPAYLLGSGVRRISGRLENNSCFVMPESWDIPLPQSLLRLTLKAQWKSELPEPCYLRTSEAEENLSIIAAERGMDIQQAMKLLAGKQNP